MTRIYPLKLDERIMPIIELKSKEEHTNKSIVLKQMIYQGLEEYVLQLCENGRISVSKAAQILGQSIYDIHRIAKEKRIKLTANEEQLEKSRKLMEKLSRAG